MKPSSIALFATIVAVGHLSGCATTGSTPVGDTESSTSATHSATKTDTAPAGDKPATGAAEPECD